MIVRACRITCAEPAKVTVSEKLIADLKTKCGENEQNVCFLPGLHYGSQVPADPTRHQIYDLLPAASAERVRNRSEFSLMRGISLWLGDADSQHAVFVRQPEKDFVAYMIGLGQSFRFNTRPRGLFSMDLAMLDTEDSWEHTVAGLDRINSLNKHDLSNMANEIPVEWWAVGDRSANHIIEQLLHRRTQLPMLLAALQFNSAPTPHRKTAGSAGRIVRIDAAQGA